MRLCIRERSFDFDAYEALKTRVTLREALEIEAVLLVNADNDHAFQTWHGDVWVPRKNKQGSDGRQPIGDFIKSVTGTQAIDVEVVKREHASNADAITDTERLLQTHRAAVVNGEDGFSHQVVGVLETQLECLQNSKVLLNDQLVGVLGEGWNVD